MKTPVEKRNHAKFYEFHGEVGHNTNECMHLKKQIEEMLKAGKLSMIIEAEIGGHCVHRMYVDGGSASEILYEHCFSRLRPEIKKQLIPATTPLIGFSVVRSSSSYNGIIERPGVKKLQAVSSTAHGMLKIPVEEGVITQKSSKLVSLECAVVSGPEGAPSTTKPIIEERIKVAVNLKYLERTVMIGSTLTEEGRKKLCGLLQRNLDIFA
ncbi:hypothetical protein Tco_0667029 [Tanacetum coccineum]